MALIVLDDSVVGVQKTPSGGFAIQLKEITGFDAGLTLFIPFEGEIAEQMYEQISDCLGKNPSSVLTTATPAQARQEASQHGLDPAE